MGSKDYFDNVAPQWDEMRESFFSSAVRDKALAIIDARPGKIAGDIGAGSGFITEGLIRAGVQVIAVDQSETMLGVIKQKFEGTRCLDCRVGNAERLPIADATVDYAFANMSLHHVDSPQQAILEMARILKPRGKLVIADLDKHAFEFLKEEHHDRWMGFEAGEIRQWLAGAGLINIVIESAGETCCAQSECGSEHARITIFFASAEK
jgi:ubiquinone/menaquinone biosynthesis C-methylase UbiE